MTGWVPAALLGLCLAAFAATVWRKHRQTWGELFRIRSEINELQGQLVLARKELVLQQIAGTTRLPPLMPSQNGEDLELWNFFGRRRNGFFVDVGAYDGVGFSNSYFLEAVGWNGVLVEAAPDLYARCVEARLFSTVVHAAAGSRDGVVSYTVAWGERGVATLSSMTPDLDRIAREGGRIKVVDVPIRTLNSLLEGIEVSIDFVSIDVEGAELEVLRGFDLRRFKPALLVIEENSESAGREVREYLAAFGYRPSRQIEQNVFYTVEPGQVHSQ